MNEALQKLLSPTSKSFPWYVPTVYQMSTDIEFDSLLYGKINEYPISEMEWRKTDAKDKANHSSYCAALHGRFRPSECDCYENDAAHYWYTDGKVWRTRKGVWSVKGHTLWAVRSEFYLTVLKSPLVWQRGLCSPCFPNQCDASAPGEKWCYALGEEYLSDYFLEGLKKPEEE